MEDKRILYVSSEVVPYLAENEVSLMSYDVPKMINDQGGQIRIFMPRYGNINERRHQLHEVIRLSGMNLIIDDNDQPLIIKVASIQAARMQVYFIDNEEYFQRKYVVTDKNDQFYGDNDERMLFFCKGVIETVKKLGWSPDVIHCQGWMAALIPILIKQNFKDDPLFAESRVVVSLYDDAFTSDMDHRLAEKLMMDGIEAKDVELLKTPSYLNLMKHAISFSDGVIIAQDGVSEDLIAFARNSKKPVLDSSGDVNYAESYSTFYDEVLLGEPVAEMAE